MASEGEASEAVGRWEMETSDGVSEAGRAEKPGSGGGGGSGEKELNDGCGDVGERMYGFRSVMDAGFPLLSRGVEGMLCA